jgi:pimeloyl-ACP methyl ester carboxylesterase
MIASSTSPDSSYFGLSAPIGCASTDAATLRLLFVPLAGAGDSDEKPPSPPGRLVDVGGYRLHLWSMGKGSPTVVLDAGMGDFSFTWGLVQPEVAKFTRVCSYDRAGSAWSDAGPTPRTMKQEVHELRVLLRRAGIRPPYVMVGASYGGLLSRLYARNYPGEVAGMVLVDSTDPDTTLSLQAPGQAPRLVRIREGWKGRPVPPVQTMKSSPPRPLSEEERKQLEESRKSQGTPRVSPPHDRLPEDLQKLDLWARTHRRPGAGNEFWPEEMQEMYEQTQREPHPLGDMPLIVLAPAGKPGSGTPPRGTSVEGWQRLGEEKRRQKEAQARLSRSGKFVRVEESGHHIHLDQPAKVVEAIREVVEAARQRTRRRHRAPDGRIVREEHDTMRQSVATPPSEEGGPFR